MFVIECFILTKNQGNSKNKSFLCPTETPSMEKSIDCYSLDELGEPLFEYVDSHDPGMQIRETTRNKSFRMISNWFIYFCAFLDQEYQYIDSVPKYIVFPHFTDESSTISKEKEQQKEKTMSSTPSPHRRQLQLDERFGCIQLMGREQRVASRCYTSFSETRQCLSTRPR